MGLHDSDGSAGLHQHGFIVFQCLQSSNHCVVAAPIAGSLSGATVDNQFLRVFGYRRIKVVLQHAHCCFLSPTWCGASGTAGRVDLAGGVICWCDQIFGGHG